MVKWSVTVDLKTQRLEFDARFTRVADGDTINVRKLGGTGKRD